MLICMIVGRENINKLMPGCPLGGHTYPIHNLLFGCYVLLSTSGLFPHLLFRTLSVSQLYIIVAYRVVNYRSWG